MAPYAQLTARKNCVAIDLDIKGFSTRKIDKKLNCQYSIVSRVKLVILKERVDQVEKELLQ